MIKLSSLISEQKEEYPPFMYSPIGFSCHVCEYYYKEGDKHKCRNEHYQEYRGTDELVDDKGNQIKDPSKWCSNWFHPKSND